MKKITFESIVDMMKKAEIEATPSQMDNLREQYESFTIARGSRVEPRIYILRSLIAKGIPMKTIATELRIQVYQIRTAFYKRKTIDNDINWSVDELMASTMYKTMSWTEAEFNVMLKMPKSKDFDYVLIEAFRDTLVMKAEPTMEVESDIADNQVVTAEEPQMEAGSDNVVMETPAMEASFEVEMPDNDIIVEMPKSEKPAKKTKAAKVEA